MRVACISDLHGNLPSIPECDLLVIAGDVCPVTNHEPHFQRNWLLYAFTEWLENQAARGIEIVGVAGNHDFILQDQPGLGEELPWHYLEDSRVNLLGAEIYGSPYSNQFGNWAFMESEEKLVERWKNIWTQTGPDILIVHGPPYGMGDRVNNDWGTAKRDPHVGSRSLNDAIMTFGPELTVTGHIHEARGLYVEYGNLVVNASHVTDRYEPLNDAVVVELV